MKRKKKSKEVMEDVHEPKEIRLERVRCAFVGVSLQEDGASSPLESSSKAGNP